MGGIGGGGGTQVIQAPAPPPNPDQDPATIQALANIAIGQYQTEVVQPMMQQISAQEQQQIPLEYGVTGFFPEQQQEYAQTATAQVQDLSSSTSVSAEIAAQQSMFQAGLANLNSMQAAAQQRSQLQAANYQAYSQMIPNMAMGFGNLFNQGQGQQQQGDQFQAPQGPTQMPGQMNVSGGIM
jgi:3-oxoacyl-ACP reductase-like protein